METPQLYPLTWPAGAPRSKSRNTSQFRTSLAGALKNKKGSSMKQIPILYSKPMILACLQGRKTQTRRILENQPPAGMGFDAIYTNGVNGKKSVRFRGGAGIHTQPLPMWKGDVLWVKESYRLPEDWNNYSASSYPWKQLDYSTLRYEADGSILNEVSCVEFIDGRLRPSIFMPKWASRMSQIVTDVRVQRLQDISKQDCQKEGHPRDHYQKYSDQVNLDAARDWYMDLWDSLNGKPRRLSNGSLGYDISWDANPWVVATTFEVVNKNINVLELPS